MQITADKSFERMPALVAVVIVAAHDMRAPGEIAHIPDVAVAVVLGVDDDDAVVCRTAQVDLVGGLVGRRSFQFLVLTEEELASAWHALVQSGICIRPRALMTTLYLRCFVADLFVHGIGGGTYDELTDDIMRHWLGIEPPTFFTSSASLHLPFNNSQIEAIDPMSTSGQTGPAIERELQLMRSVPERFLDRSIESERLLYERHARKIANIPMRGSKRQWHQEVAQLKQQIEASIESKKRTALAKLTAFQHAGQQSKILRSREYSFVLFEESDVVGRLSKLAKAAMNAGSDAGK